MIDNITAESHLLLENDFIRELSLMEEDITPKNTLHPPLVDICNRPYSPSPSIDDTVGIVSLAETIVKFNKQLMMVKERNSQLIKENNELRAKTIHTETPTVYKRSTEVSPGPLEMSDNTTEKLKSNGMQPSRKRE